MGGWSGRVIEVFRQVEPQCALGCGRIDSGVHQ